MWDLLDLRTDCGEAGALLSRILSALALSELTLMSLNSLSDAAVLMIVAK